MRLLTGKKWMKRLSGRISVPASVCQMRASRRYVVVLQLEVAVENPPVCRQLSLYKEDAEWLPYLL